MDVKKIEKAVSLCKHTSPSGCRYCPYKGKDYPDCYMKLFSDVEKFLHVSEIVVHCRDCEFVKMCFTYGCHKDGNWFCADGRKKHG